jgi:hypothetical protein
MTAHTQSGPGARKIDAAQRPVVNLVTERTSPILRTLPIGVPAALQTPVGFSHELGYDSQTGRMRTRKLN